MSNRTNVSGGGKLEDAYGYSRAVRVGNVIKVAGTCSTDVDGSVVGEGDAATQAVRCFEIIGAALEAAGAGLGNIVSTRIYLTNIDDAPAVGEVHGQMFAEVKPAVTMLQVSAFVNPAFLVEIECEAMVADDENSTGVTH